MAGRPGQKQLARRTTEAPIDLAVIGSAWFTLVNQEGAFGQLTVNQNAERTPECLFGAACKVN